MNKISNFSLYGMEVWSRGTNRVIEMCQQHGTVPPVFEEWQGFLVVTFKAQMVPVLERPESQPESQPESLDRRVLALLKSQALGKAEISEHLGQKEVSGQLNKVIRGLMGKGLIEYTLPDKPNSRLQKYQLASKGQSLIKIVEKEAGADEE
ncbi:MAG: hypothetical protein JW932_14890 [Deltaproteobacteria bacterium]|nr:hypothetical protein [Deltaproteobacteria bacterium]